MESGSIREAIFLGSRVHLEPEEIDQHAMAIQDFFNQRIATLGACLDLSHLDLAPSEVLSILFESVFKAIPAYKTSAVAKHIYGGGR